MATSYFCCLFLVYSDRKSCQNIEENIDEISCNAAGFTWSPHLNAKIVIRINCLSTDFSSQKGVKVGNKISTYFCFPCLVSDCTNS